MEMSEPGVTVLPLRQMSGAYHFNEVFLEDVFVAEEGLIGGLGDGWSVLKTMLASERASIGGGTSARGRCSSSRWRNGSGVPTTRSSVRPSPPR